MEFPEFNPNDLTPILLEYGQKLIMIIIVLIVGLWIINLLTKGLSKAMVKQELDASLTSFLKSLISIAFKSNANKAFKE